MLKKLTVVSKIADYVRKIIKPITQHFCQEKTYGYNRKEQMKRWKQNLTVVTKIVLLTNS